MPSLPTVYSDSIPMNCVNMSGISIDPVLNSWASSIRRPGHASSVRNYTLYFCLLLFPLRWPVECIFETYYFELWWIEAIRDGNLFFSFGFTYAVANFVLAGLLFIRCLLLVFSLSSNCCVLGDKTSAFGTTFVERRWLPVILWPCHITTGRLWAPTLSLSRVCCWSSSNCWGSTDSDGWDVNCCCGTFVSFREERPSEI